ncbi:MAG: DNA-3-methyladenine glycosylase 2 family protein, partial [Myxococcota bacterium]
AVLGQQVSVAAARTLAGRLVARWGRPAVGSAPEGLSALFPGPSALAAVTPADLAGIGLTTRRANTVREVARAVLRGAVGFDRDEELDVFVARWVAVPGVGPWTAQYIAMRALGHGDAFPDGDLVLRRAAAPAGQPLSARELRTRAEAWRPWRAYAAIHLWRSAARTANRRS